MLLYGFKSIDEIRSHFRKGTKYEIGKGKNLVIQFYDDKSITEDEILDCRRIYEYDAGKVTRTSEMIMHYYKWIRSGYTLRE